VFVLQGRIVQGSTPGVGAADLLFVDDNFVCIFKENLFLPDDKNNIIFAKDVTTDNIEIEMTDGYIGANNTTYGIAPLEDFTVDSIQMDGMTFDSFTAITASSDSTHNWTNIKFNAGSTVIPDAATFNNITLNNFIAGSLGLWLKSTAVNCSDFIFKNSLGDYYSFFTSHGAEFDFDNFDFQDANATDVLLASGIADAVAVSALTSVGTLATVTTSAAHGLSTNDWVEMAGATETEYNGFFKITVNTTTEFEYTMTGDPTSPATGSPTWEEALIINNLNGSNASTYAAAFGEIDFVSSVPLSFEAVDKTDTAISGVQVSVYLVSDNSEVFIDDTIGTGFATGTYGGSTPVDIYYRYRKASTGATKYVNLSGFGTISGTGITVKRSMTEDTIADPAI